MNKFSTDNANSEEVKERTLTGREYITIPEFAQRVSLSTKTIRRRIESGDLPAWQPGGPRTRVLIPVSCLAQDNTLTDESSHVHSNLPNKKSRKLSGPTPNWMQN